MLLAVGGAFYYFYLHRNRGKSFINSEGELVNKNKREEMIDEKYFDETVADEATPELGNTDHDGINYDDDTYVPNRGPSVHYNSRPNNAVNF